MLYHFILILNVNYHKVMNKSIKTYFCVFIYPNCVLCIFFTYILLFCSVKDIYLWLKCNTKMLQANLVIKKICHLP